MYHSRTRPLLTWYECAVRVRWLSFLCSDVSSKQLPRKRNTECCLQRTWRICRTTTSPKREEWFMHAHGRMFFESRMDLVVHTYICACSRSNARRTSRFFFVPGVRTRTDKTCKARRCSVLDRQDIFLCMDSTEIHVHERHVACDICRAYGSAAKKLASRRRFLIGRNSPYTIIPIEFCCV